MSGSNRIGGSNGPTYITGQTKENEVTDDRHVITNKQIPPENIQPELTEKSIHQRKTSRSADQPLTDSQLGMFKGFCRNRNFAVFYQLFD